MVGMGSHASVAVALPVFAGRVLAVHWMVTLAGQLIVGATLSVTTTVCTQVLELPHPSEAIHVRVIVISNGHVPPTVTSLKVIVGVAAQLSVAVADPVAGGNVPEEQFIVTLAGHVITGARLSSTNMI